jgi:hypothetical protein
VRNRPFSGDAGHPGPRTEYGACRSKNPVGIRITRATTNAYDLRGKNTETQAAAGQLAFPIDDGVRRRGRTLLDPLSETPQPNPNPSDEQETPLGRIDREFREKLRAAGVTVREMDPLPPGENQVTFIPARRTPPPTDNPTGSKGSNHWKE